MKIPKNEVVKFVVKSALHRQTAHSQTELASIVDTELKRVNPEYSITGRRLRRLAIDMPEVGVRVSVKKGKMPEKCPSCTTPLVKSWTMNLNGEKVIHSLKCDNCGYKSHGERWAPSRYWFWLNKEE